MTPENKKATGKSTNNSEELIFGGIVCGIASLLGIVIAWIGWWSALIAVMIALFVWNWRWALVIILAFLWAYIDLSL